MRKYPALIVRAQADAGFEEIVAAAVDGLGAVAIDETGDGGVRVFFSDVESRDAAIDTVQAALPGASVEPVDVPDENWAERSQAALTAVRAGSLTIAPPWDIPSDGRDVVVILPSTGFGTGHHATTKLCLEALQAAEPAGKSVVDVGTGSGVLALAAAKLGASRVVGIDNDPDALANAHENMTLNGLEVEFRHASLGGSQLARAEIVLANLTGAVLIRFCDELKNLRAVNGRLIVSGLREEEERDVVSAFGAPSLSRAAIEGWVCLSF